MSTVPPNQPSVRPQPSAKPDDQTPVPPPFDEQLRMFWEKNHQAVFVGVTLVLLAVVGRYAYEIYATQREARIEAEFAAMTTPARLEAFARAQDNHPLAGAAWLKLADDEYSTGRAAEALASYERAATVLAGTPFASRVLLGKAMCLLQLGRTDEGRAALKKLADDDTQLRGVRGEAAYHLASLAFENGDFEECVKRADQVLQFDSAGAWAQRAILLKARTPATAQAAAPAPGIGQPAPAVSIKVPGS